MRVCCTRSGLVKKDWIPWRVERQLVGQCFGVPQPLCCIWQTLFRELINSQTDTFRRPTILCHCCENNPCLQFPSQGTARKVQTPICKSDATVRKACLKVDAKRWICRALKQRMRTGNKNADQTTQTFWFDISSMDNNSHVSYDVVRIHYMCVSNKHAWLSYIFFVIVAHAPERLFHAIIHQPHKCLHKTMLTIRWRIKFSIIM